jgi:hypothetical protein
MRLIRPIAIIALLASSFPAHADVILTYHLSTFVPAVPGDVPPATQIPVNDPLGPALTGPGIVNPNSPTNPLVFAPGQTRFIQIAIQANAASPTAIGVDNQANWTPSWGGAGNTMTTFAFGMQYPLALVWQPYLPPMPPSLTNNFRNARAQSGPQPDGSVPGYAFASGFPSWYTDYNMGGTAITGLDLNAGLGTSNAMSNGVGLLSDTNLAVFKFRAWTSPGSGVITLFDLNTAPSAAGFGLLDGTNLDSFIFSAAHGGQTAFPLYIQVVVPEPSSLCLAALAVAGIGWRRWRRRAVAKFEESQLCGPRI